MKGLYIQKFDSPTNSFEWKTLTLPALQNDEVLIETSSFGINYADVMARQGLYGEAPPLPFIPGYEVVGKVTQTGDFAQEFLNKKVVAFTRFGGYATHAITKTSAIVELEDTIPEEDAIALATQYVTAFYATNYLQAIRKGEIVLIQAAAGGVGIALNQLCKNAGAITIGLCGGSEKVEFCKSQNFDYVFDYTNDDYLAEIKQLFPQGIDVCFNSLAGKSFKKDKSLLNFTGRIVLYGGASRSGMKGGTLASLKMVWQMGIVIPIGMMMSSRSIIGINMLKVADYKPQVIQFCLQSVFDLYKRGVLKPVIKSVFTADEVYLAHELVENRKSIGKVVCKF